MQILVNHYEGLLVLDAIHFSTGSQHERLLVLGAAYWKMVEDDASAAYEVPLVGTSVVATTKSWGDKEIQMKLIRVIEGETEEKNQYELEMTDREALLVRELMSRVTGDSYSSYKRVADNVLERLSFLLGLPYVEDEEPYYVTSGELRASPLPENYLRLLDERDAESGKYWPQSSIKPPQS